MSIHVGSSLGCPLGWASPVLRAWPLPRALGGMLATLSSFLHLAFLTCKVEAVKLPHGEGQRHTGNQPAWDPTCTTGCGSRTESKGAAPQGLL